MAMPWWWYARFMRPLVGGLPVYSSPLVVLVNFESASRPASQTGLPARYGTYMSVHEPKSHACGCIWIRLLERFCLSGMAVNSLTTRVLWW